mmetsp:Transcript_735/g.2495  ORF Transcript_735/g.2495 Transcript_735/m.2495 type:complete len:528 (-) Transcript_735:2384-3967(-)
MPNSGRNSTRGAEAIFEPDLGNQQQQQAPPRKRARTASAPGGNRGGRGMAGTNGRLDTNGEGMNGAGSREHDEYIGPQGLINRTEYLRVIEQALHRLGYSGVAEQLEQESHVPMQTQAVSDFKTAVLRGEWAGVLEVLPQLHFQDSDDTPIKEAKFLILQQKYIEALLETDSKAALACLRKELTPLKTNTAQLHVLASWMMCPSKEDLLARVREKIAGGESRESLLRRLQELLPAHVVLQEGRLEVLIEEALVAQRRACMYHNSTHERFSLLSRHECGVDQIPSEAVAVLDAHADEVWHLRFSNSGEMLASASKDCTAIIWKVKSPTEVVPMHVLKGHSKALAFVAWSPDDTMLVTCGNDSYIKLWDVATGSCMHTFTKHTESVTACAWMPDGKRFVSGGLDKCTYMWNIDGQVVAQWKGHRINDLAVTHDGSTLVSICSEKKIRVFHLEEEREDIIAESGSVTSICLSRDSRQVLVNLSCQEVHLVRAPSPLHAASEAASVQPPARCWSTLQMLCPPRRIADHCQL